MPFLPLRRPARRRTLHAVALALALACTAAGCAGGRNDLLAGSPSRAFGGSGTGAPGADTAGTVADGSAAPTGLPATPGEVAALAAALDRFNQNQAEIQAALADQQRSAAQQIAAAKQTSDELMSARHLVLVWAIVAAAAVLASLLLAVVVVRQTGQVRRATRALAAAHAELEAAATALAHATPGGSALQGPRGGVGAHGAHGAAATAGAAPSAPGSAAGGGGTGGSAPGAGLPTAARLRKRPPVG